MCLFPRCQLRAILVVCRPLRREAHMRLQRVEQGGVGHQAPRVVGAAGSAARAPAGRRQARHQQRHMLQACLLTPSPAQVHADGEAF